MNMRIWTVHVCATQSTLSYLLIQPSFFMFESKSHDLDRSYSEVGGQMGSTESR
jgi:hypothetical protein